MMKEYLLSSENVALYGECRAFLTCIKENHGGIFRLVVFSSLLDPEKKLKTLQQQENNLKVKGKSSHVFMRQDAINNNAKGVRFFHCSDGWSTCLSQATLNRDMSDDTDLDRHGSNGQQLQATGTEDNLSANMAASTSSVKLKGKVPLISSIRFLSTWPIE